MNGCRGGSTAATGSCAAGAPTNAGSDAASGPSGIGAGGAAPAGPASARNPAAISSTLRTALIVRGRSLERRRSGRLRGLLLAVVRRDGDERGLDAALDRLLGHDALLDVAPRGQLELHLQEDLLDDRAQAAGAG